MLYSRQTLAEAHRKWTVKHRDNCIFSARWGLKVNNKFKLPFFPLFFFSFLHFKRIFFKTYIFLVDFVLFHWKNSKLNTDPDENYRVIMDVLFAAYIFHLISQVWSSQKYLWCIVNNFMIRSNLKIKLFFSL